MIPHFFSKLPIPVITNKSLQAAIKQVREANSQSEALETAFRIITTRYRGYRFHTFLFFWKAFQSNPNHLWQRTGFLHCTHLNYLLRILLVNSGWFSESDIQLKFTNVYFCSIHQYLRVRMGKSSLALDAWGHVFGVPLGQFWFGTGPRSLK